VRRLAGRMHPRLARPRDAARRAGWPASLARAATAGRPLSHEYGFDRGLPVDRFYVEDFLRRFGGTPGYAVGAIQGRVLEVGGRPYADRFGDHAAEPAPGKVHHVDVLHADASHPDATIVGDLTDPSTVPAEAFDCVIATQTLHVIYDFRAVVRTLHHALAPGGTALVTVPGITRSCVPDRDIWGDWWRFTEGSARRIFGEVFAPEDVHVEAYGNLTAAFAALAGLSAHELPAHRLQVRDREFDVLVGVRAVKAS
jgi:SAM-dependent methyltransferase